MSWKQPQSYSRSPPASAARKSTSNLEGRWVRTHWLTPSTDLQNQRLSPVIAHFTIVRNNKPMCDSKRFTPTPVGRCGYKYLLLHTSSARLISERARRLESWRPNIPCCPAVQLQTKIATPVRFGRRFLSRCIPFVLSLSAFAWLNWYLSVYRSHGHRTVMRIPRRYVLG